MKRAILQIIERMFSPCPLNAPNPQLPQYNKIEWTPKQKTPTKCYNHNCLLLLQF